MKQTLPLLGLLALTSCATLDKVMTGSNLMPDDEQRAKIAASDKSLTDKQKNSFIAGTPPIGVSKDKIEKLFNNTHDHCKQTINEVSTIETCWLTVRFGSIAQGFHSKTWLIAYRNGMSSTIQDKY